MKTYKTVTRPARTEQEQDKVICDVCKQEIPRPDTYEVSEIEVKHRKGNSYPEGGSGTEKTCDICPVCFETKVVPALEALGVTFAEPDWDW